MERRAVTEREQSEVVCLLSIVEVGLWLICLAEFARDETEYTNYIHTAQELTEMYLMSA